MTMTEDATTTVRALRLAVQRFNDARDWHQFHTPKNVATSVAIEAAELLEHFQWTEDLPAERKAAVLEELADVVIYCLTLIKTHVPFVQWAVHPFDPRCHHRHRARLAH